MLLKGRGQHLCWVCGSFHLVDALPRAWSTRSRARGPALPRASGRMARKAWCVANLRERERERESLQAARTAVDIHLPGTSAVDAGTISTACLRYCGCIACARELIGGWLVRAADAAHGCCCWHSQALCLGRHGAGLVVWAPRWSPRCKHRASSPRPRCCSRRGGRAPCACEARCRCEDATAVAAP